MALEASKRIKTKFGEVVHLEDFTLESDEGKQFNVKSSSNVFVNRKLLPIKIWSDQYEFERHIRKIIGKEVEDEKVNGNIHYCDVLIVGGGPAGLTAGLYCARAKRRTILLEGQSLGGQIRTTHRIENYPGFVEGSAVKLIENMERQATDFGLKIDIFKKVYRIDLGPPFKRVYAADDIYECNAVILACGLKRNELGLERESAFGGKGVSYCGVCDANLFKGKQVAVVGGGDSAMEDAIYLSRFAAHVFVVHIFDELQANKSLQDVALQNQKITFLWKHKVEEINGNSALSRITLRDLTSGSRKEFNLEGLFIAIGACPHNDFYKDKLSVDDQGYVLVNSEMETSVPGVFAAGDMRVTPLRQVSTAVGDGAIAAISAEKYLAKLESE
ncbi:MAG: thioredoxin-disulfide reductase [Desulfocapsa sp.]|nr:thioredoxin-disulfide reductase [Desulfocapsa sp.]